VAAKLAIEGGQIPKTDLEGKSSDHAMTLPRVCEAAVGLGETLAEHELRQRRAIALEQPLNIARSDMMASRERSNRDITVSQIPNDIGLDRAQPRGA
jgi:hypothetical protein